MSGPDQRKKARDEFDPGKVAEEARADLRRAQNLVRSLQASIAKGTQLIRRSQVLIARIPDRW